MPLTKKEKLLSCFDLCWKVRDYSYMTSARKEKEGDSVTSDSFCIFDQNL